MTHAHAQLDIAQPPTDVLAQNNKMAATAYLPPTTDHFVPHSLCHNLPIKRHRP